MPKEELQSVVIWFLMGNYNYQVGNGDFATMTALKNTEEYQGITNFAHAIVGGKLHNISPLSGSSENGWALRCNTER